MRWCALLIITLAARLLSAAPIGVAYYNVDRLYDTIPSRFYNDRDFTPSGRHRWGSERYNHKISSTVEVIDSLRMPIIALAGVENEQVVRDIVMRSSKDYSYLHRTLNSSDGLDVALLYFGDMVYPRYVKSYRDWLYVEFASLHEEWSFGLYITRGNYNIRSADPPHAMDPPDNIIIMGGIRRERLEQLGLQDPLLKEELQGYGNALGNKGWYLRDRIGISGEAEPISSGIFIKRWLLSRDGRIPFATFYRNSYMGGYGQFMPIFIYFDPIKIENK